MDIVLLGFILGVVLLVFATIWNYLISPDKKKVPSAFFKHFMQHYGFTTNDEARAYNGFYKGRSVQLQSDPPGALIQVANPRGVHLIIEKGRATQVPDLMEAEVEGLRDVTIKSNYPQLLKQFIDEDLITSLNEAQQYSYELKEGVFLRTPKMRNPLQFEPLLDIGIRLATAIERINYLDKK